MSERTKRAVVTGGAGVIGKACCRRLLADGYGVLAVDLDKDLGAVLVEELDAGDQLTFHASDVTNELDVEGYVQQAIATFGGIDAFFNNAGVEGLVAPIVSYPVDAFDRVIAVNLRGVFLGLKYVMAAMAQGGGGSIVNTASVAGLIGSPGLAPYIASKHGVVGLTKTAALEGAAIGVRVNAVCPGPVDSRMMESLEDGVVELMGMANREAAHAEFAQRVPVGRYAKPEEVADLVAYLLSDRAAYVSGAAIPVDWGFTAQ